MISVRSFLDDYWQGILHLLYPQTCGACGDVLSGGETLFCFSCEAQMPETGFHRLPQDGHPAFRRFWGRLDTRAIWCSWHMTGEGPLRHLLHALKYRGKPDLAKACGAYYGEQLIHDGVMKGVDAFTFVPMHPRKESARGFNPAREIASGLAEASGLPMHGDWLQRLSDKQLKTRLQSGSQTQKDRFERWESVRQLYVPGRKYSELAGLQSPHVVLVDDVMTTGATLEVCGNLLTEAGATVTLLTLAATG